MLVFYKSFHQTTNNHMELSVLNDRLKLVEEKNLLLIKINSDSSKVITILNDGNLHYNVLIDDCRSRLRKLGYPGVTHCYWDQNGVVNTMTKKGEKCTDFEATRLFEVPSMCATSAVWTDIIETFFVKEDETFFLKG